MTLTLNLELPMNFDPVEYLIKDQESFFHSLKSSCILADPDIKKDTILTHVGFASGAVANRSILYQFFLESMPDSTSKSMLRKLILEMDTLADFTFGRTLEDMKSCIEERGKLVGVIDSILSDYYTMAHYLKSKH